jgi:hypothetical protein
VCDECRYPGELAQQEPDEDAEAYEKHCEAVHGDGECDCPQPVDWAQTEPPGGYSDDPPF